MPVARCRRDRDRHALFRPAVFGGRRSLTLAPAKPARKTNVRRGEMLPETYAGPSGADSAVKGPLTVLRWLRNLHTHSPWSPACTAGVSRRLGDIGDEIRCLPVAFR